MGNHVQMPRDEVGKLLVDFVEDLERRFALFFYGFDISYVDIQDNRLETFSYSTDKYLQVTEGGIKDKNVGSILRKESLHLDPAEPDFYELGSEVNYALHETKEYRLPFHAEFDKLDAVAASPELWGAFYKEQGFSGHFAIGGVIDEPFRYRLILFSVFDGLEKDKETLVKVYLANFIEKKIRGVIFTRFRETFKEMRNQATRAAISQVMARNASHNIGSHVLSKFKAKEHILTDNPNESYAIESPPVVGKSDPGSRTVKSTIQYKGHNHLNTFEVYDDNGALAYYDNESLIAYFNEYLKNRMDLLADIATSDPVMENPKFLYTEIFKGFDRNRILLNRISGVSDPKLKFGFELTDSRKDRSTPVTIKAVKKDILVSMTNDVLGAQAFYIILENIIRNICKHSRRGISQDKPIKITIDVGENSDHPMFYEVSVFDNLPMSSFPAGELDDTVSSDKMRPVPGSIEELLVKRNSDFNKDLIDKTDQSLRPTGLGTIEMDVCASYLRCLPIGASQNNSYFDLKFCGDGKPKENDREDGHEHSFGEVTNNCDTKNGPMLMFAYKQPYPPEDPISEGGARRELSYTLGYKFYLPKPKEVLMIADDLSDFKIKGCEAIDFPYHGIRALAFDRLREELAKGEVFKHQFMYVHSGPEDLRELLDNYFGSLPRRIVTRLSDPSFENPQQFVSRIWEVYATTKVLKEGKIIRFTNETIKTQIVSEKGKLIPSFCEDSGNGGQHFRILIDNHNPYWCEKEPENGEAKAPCNDRECVCQQNDYKPTNRDYYDMKCGHTRLNDKLAEVLAGTTSSPEFNQKRAEYLEAVFTEILIIDERIQANIVDDPPARYSDTVPVFHQYFRQQGVHIPLLPNCLKTKNGHTDECDHAGSANLNVTDFGSMEEKGNPAYDIREFIRAHIGKEKVKFCVIHLGLIEKMIERETQNGKDGVTVLETIYRLFSENEQHVNKLIITSGRGTPDNMPISDETKTPFIPFVPLAPIQNAIETQHDKILLTKLLFNSRRTKGDGSDNRVH